MAEERKVAQTYRISEEGRRKAKQIAESLGLTQAGVVELAIREMWKRLETEGDLSAQTE